MTEPTKPTPTNALIQQKRTVADLINSEKTRTEIAKVLPKHLTPERMTRVALTATMKNPKLLDCTPASLLNALLVCSQAGLEPDGRLAHLIPYGNVVQVIFDYKGLVTLAIRNGMQAVYADKVCEFDHFEAVVEDGAKKLNHRVSWGKNRGTAICYYAVCKRGGEVDWEVMTTDEVESVRSRSRAKDSGPWVTDFDEMAKKTVLRRLSKRWDLLPEIRDIINADDDVPPALERIPTTRPVFEAKVEASPAPEPEPAAQVEPQSNEDSENNLVHLRALLAKAKITEGALLDYLASSGVTDGSPTSLEELAMSYEKELSMLIEQWDKESVKILAAGKKGSK